MHLRVFFRTSKSLKLADFTCKRSKTLHRYLRQFWDWLSSPPQPGIANWGLKKKCGINAHENYNEAAVLIGHSSLARVFVRPSESITSDDGFSAHEFVDHMH